ncbi:hypothetical protein LCGC14_2926240 [marine sediment metagenome]|uniref:Uncharacterized protein n=1 Tax=marine sediment metagenome TaxID=412755 RepID=A0A0F8ZV18_9ZZZZ
MKHNGLVSTIILCIYNISDDLGSSKRSSKFWQKKVAEFTLSSDVPGDWSVRVNRYRRRDKFYVGVTKSSVRRTLDLMPVNRIDVEKVF